jgi:tRNA threonylcarbamoyladenosine biosynthesis protein TsaE
METFIVNNERDTERLGATLANLLSAGTVVGLIGTLGAGKTRLVRAVAAELGNPPHAVTSPTFVLVNEYASGRLPLYHFDAYRLKDVDEFLALGPEEYFESDGLVFVEWADRVAELLPSERLVIEIDVTGETSRTITISGTSAKMEEVAERVVNRISWHTS